MQKVSHRKTHNPLSTFKRYCFYEGHETHRNINSQAKSCEDPQSDLVRLPDTASHFTGQADAVKHPFAPADGQRYISCQNIGDTFDRKQSSRLGQRNAYSRENIQSMNRKCKMIRSTQYMSAEIVKNRQQLTLSGNVQSASGSQRLIGTAKSQSSCNLRRRVIRQRIPLHYPKKYHNNPQTTQQNELALLSSILKAKKQNFAVPTSTHFEVEGFRTKMKAKCVEDNPKILASIIKRKVDMQDRQEVMQFISRIMRKKVV